MRFGGLPGVGLGGGRRQSSCGEGKGRKSWGEKVSGKQSPQWATFYREACSGKAESQRSEGSGSSRQRQPVGVLACPPCSYHRLCPCLKISLPGHRTRYPGSAAFGDPCVTVGFFFFRSFEMVFTLCKYVKDGKLQCSNS